jgi:ferredoxin
VLAEKSVFDQSEEDGRVVVLRRRPPPELTGNVRKAVEQCPVRAITLSEY